MSPKSSSDNLSSGGYTREELAVIIEKYRATAHRLKSTQDELRESEEKLRLAVDCAQAGMWDWNIEADLLAWSDRCRKIVGVPRDMALNYGVFLSVIHPDDRTRIDRAVREALDKREDYDVEVRIPWTDGTVHWAACRGRGLYDKNGKPVRMVGMTTDITERKRAEEVLRHSEAHLARSQEIAHLGSFQWDPIRNEDEWSDEMYRILGVRRGELKPSLEVFSRFIHPEDRVTFNGLVDKFLKGQNYTENPEIRIVRPDGFVRWVSLAAKSIPGRSGNPVRIGIVVDITERKRAEEALRKSETSLARSQAIAHLANWELDIGSGRVRVSDEFYRIFNLEPGVPQEAYGEKIHPDDRARVLESVNATINEGKPYSIDYRIVPRPGEARHIHAEGETILDRDGHPISFFGTVQDITELKQAEMALRVGEERLRRASRAGRIGLYELNEDRDIVYFSPEAYELFGCDPGSPVTLEKWLAAVHPDDRETVERVITEAREKARSMSGASTQGEYRVVRKDGSVLWLEATALYALEGGDLMVRGAVRDVTERKRAEEELANAKAQAELYLDLMGHDINNFNLVARGYLELMDGMAEGELKELVSRPMGAIESSSRLIQNVQKLQRARSDGNHLDILDLGVLVEEVAGQFKSMPDEPVNITCDAIIGVRVRANELLRDVFVNLIGNAIKHSAGPADINIRMASEEKDGRGYCMVTIDDNGPGIPDDMKEKIFNRLSRGNTKAKGSGLGLYLVKSLVESYGGKVWVEDRVKGDYSKGARFVVMLPVV